MTGKITNKMKRNLIILPFHIISRDKFLDLTLKLESLTLESTCREFGVLKQSFWASEVLRRMIKDRYYS